MTCVNNENECIECVRASSLAPTCEYFKIYKFIDALKGFMRINIICVSNVM